MDFAQCLDWCNDRSLSVVLTVNRQLIYDCMPFVIGIAIMLAVLVFLLRASGARFRRLRLGRLHADEVGGVQSLSFVLTIPLFIMIMMFIVQLTQLTIARVVIEYSAYSAARSAVVWVPSILGLNDDEEQENRIGAGKVWINEVLAEDNRWYDIYQLDTSADSNSPKVQRIRLAAAMACMSICPSKATPTGGGNHFADAAAGPLTRAFFAMAPSRSGNTRIAPRIRSKLAYALRNTVVQIYVHHRRDQPFLGNHDILRDYREYTQNEIGFQDQMHVRVTHRFALLPGPGRLIAAFVARPDTDAPDTVGQRITFDQGVYTMQLTATARVQNEGEKSVWPHFEDPFGQMGPIFMTAIEAENYPPIPPRPFNPSNPQPVDPWTIPPTLPPLDQSGIRNQSRAVTGGSAAATRVQDDEEDADCCGDDRKTTKQKKDLPIRIQRKREDAEPPDR